MLFITDDFLLQTKTAMILYHDYAKKMAVFDYHNHLNPADIATDRKFENLTQVWLSGDHYKARAMRANGINEKLITGDSPDMDKFAAWAETVPYTIRNPLYHWTHLELIRYFNVNSVLNSRNAASIYEQCNSMLASADFSARQLLKRMKVHCLFTTDDPIDTLEHHQSIKSSGFDVKVLPGYRPDKAMAVESQKQFNNYLLKLENSCCMEIKDFDLFLEALKKRHDFFHLNGCRISDHGIETVYALNYTQKEIKRIFKKIRSKKELNPYEISQFKSAMMIEFAVMDYDSNWVQQLHIGVLRNNNTKWFKKIGPDTGFDSIGDSLIAHPLSCYLDKLSTMDKLPKTILYNINPKDNEVLATMTGNFQDSSIPGKMQFGAAWWFLDQKDGIEKQLNCLSNFGLISRFIGMLTDARSLLSYPRHEYFRRILCNLIGQDVENGELENDIPLLGKIIQDICFNNAAVYFEEKLVSN